MRFFERRRQNGHEGSKSSVKKRWSWKWPEERLEHIFGNIGPIKYRIGDCIKKLTFLGLHGVELCGVKTK